MLIHLELTTLAHVFMHWGQRGVALGKYRECREGRRSGTTRRRSEGDSTEENPAQLPKASQLSSYLQYFSIEVQHKRPRCRGREYYKQ